MKHGFLMDVRLNGRCFYARTPEVPTIRGAKSLYANSLKGFCTVKAKPYGPYRVPPPSMPKMFEGQRSKLFKTIVSYPGYYMLDKLLFQDMPLYDWYEFARLLCLLEDAHALSLSMASNWPLQNSWQPKLETLVHPSQHLRLQDFKHE